MRIGFTGTQKGMTDNQQHSLSMLLDEDTYQTFHHGGCIGADEEAGYMAQDLGYEIVVHPGVDRNGRVVKRGRYGLPDEVREEKFFLDRNKDIVDETELLIATPEKFIEEVRSGTWSTVRYAKSKNKKVIVVWPDGRVQDYE